MTDLTTLTISDILARKAEGRRNLARLSFAEKVRIVEGMRERMAPFNAMREKRKAAAAKRATGTRKPVSE